jgi:hypothetical protein
MKITEHNATTGEVIERQLTTKELKQYELDLAANENRISELEIQKNAKAALLERLGITADEAALLFK